MEEQFLPRSRFYYVVIEEMNFTITETLRASRVEKWIRAVKRRFLDAAPIKCVGLDCEFTTVTSQDFIKFWGNFFAFDWLEMIGNSQGFKTF
jgi:hypothetical protein